MHVAVRPGVALEVLDWGGCGTPLVFLTGYGNTVHIFDDFALRFRDRYRVLAITRRGFGASTLAASGYDTTTLAADILAVLDSLQLDRPVLVAHSFGGAELNALVMQRPSAARAVAYLERGFDFAELYADSAWTKVPIRRPLRQAADDRSPSAEARYEAVVMGPGFPEAEIRVQNALAASLRTAPASHADSIAAWLMRGTPRFDFAEIRVPALATIELPRTVAEKYPWSTSAPQALGSVRAHCVSWSRRRSSSDSARDSAGEVRDARVIEIEGGWHYVFLTHSRGVAAAIRRFAPSKSAAR